MVTISFEKAKAIQQAPRIYAKGNSYMPDKAQR
jgi:hypothetical protein